MPSIRFFLWILVSQHVVCSSVRRVTEEYKQLTVQIPGYSPTENDDYVSVAIKAEPGYIRKFQPISDAERVHHMLLYGCDQPAQQSAFWKGGATCAASSHILYAWARNAPSLTLPDNVGFAIGNPGDPVQYIVLQIHYAKPFQGSVRDFSGVIMHLSDVRPANLAAVYLFVSGEAIPPGMDASYNNMSCSYTGETELHPFAFRTHTHAMGRVVSAYFKHEDKWHQIGKRNPQWPQLFQKSPTGLTIKKGDLMAATCRFDSHDKTEYTPMGSMGMNEMCNFYMMFYRDANSPDPFPYGGGCGYNEAQQVVAQEYPAEGLSLLPPHPELEHAAHQDAKAFGVVEKAKISKIGPHRLGQVAGLAFNRDGNLLVFHRASRVWDGSTFDSNNQLVDRTPIREPVLLLAKESRNRRGLELKAAYGDSQFYLPHGVFVDDSGYIYTTDVGSHQVIKWKVNGGIPVCLFKYCVCLEKLQQVLALGKAFEPGSDHEHFCKPASVAVSRIDGSIYVADGYCNNRIIHFSKDGKFLNEFGHQSPYQREGGRPPLGTFMLPHDITIDESRRQLFVADRENGRVQVFNEQGDALEEIAEPNFFRNVYSAHFCPGHGLFFIPGLSSQGEKIEAYMVGLSGSAKIQYSFAPKSEDFVRPHIIRVRGQTVWIGEISNEGGVLWGMEVKESNMTTHMSSAELYASSGPIDPNSGSSFLIFALVFASMAVAGFVAFMRYRDVSEQNVLVDRTGFKPLRTSEKPIDEEDSDDDFTLTSKTEP